MRRSGSGVPRGGDEVPSGPARVGPSHGTATPHDGDDLRWMERALELAARGRCGASPNPMVGAVILDAEGNLIGITSAIGVSQAGPEGIGYAIPIEMVERITAEIIETGDVVHPFLGVFVGTYFDTAADGAIFPAGGLIERIEGTDSAASLAGMQAGDVITSIGGKTIKDRTDLVLAVRLYRVGDEVEFVAEREGESMTFAVVLGQRPADLQG